MKSRVSSNLFRPLHQAMTQPRSSARGLAWAVIGLCLGLAPIAQAQPPAAFDPDICPEGQPIEDRVIDFSTRITLPPEGILCFQNLTIEAGYTLRFARNAANTPVYLLATGNITILGSIDISGGVSQDGAGGRGGPGAFDGGVGGMLGISEPGGGIGPGGGAPGDEVDLVGGHASYATRATADNIDKNGSVWGHPLLIPLVGGSGGAGSMGIDEFGRSGSGGGGAMMLAANGTIEHRGNIYASGGAWVPTGSGGAVRMVAPAVTGNGNVWLRHGGFPSMGAGRFRIDTFDRTGLQMWSNGVSSFGSFVVAFPDPMPSITITTVAGVPVNASSGTVLLAPGSDPVQPVEFEVAHFPTTVDVEIAVVPDSGPSTVYIVPSSDGRIDVNIPENTITQIHAWVR